jgi:MFS family permease
MGFLFFMINFAEFQLAGVIGSLSSALRLHPVEFSTCLFAPFLMNFMFGIPIGMLADRFGTRVVGSVLLVMSCVGIIGRVVRRAKKDCQSVFGPEHSEPACVSRTPLRFATTLRDLRCCDFI